MGLPWWLRQSKTLLAIQESWIQPLDLEDLLKKGTATPSGILAWTILWREEPGGLQSMWLQTVGHY